MSKQEDRVQKLTEDHKVDRPKHEEKRDWETPKMEDVSEQVMAQPYIRFT